MLDQDPSREKPPPRGPSVLAILSALLVLLPTGTAVLMLTDLLPVTGGHGLAEWFCLGICFVIVLLGTASSALCAVRWPARGRLSKFAVGCGLLAMLSFLGYFGLPFAR